MRTFNRDGETYTPAQIRRANPRIVYWVYFPQRVEHRYQTRRGETVVHSFGTMRVKTLKQALKLATRYNAAWMERLIECDLGRWPVKLFTIDHRSPEELYAEWRLLEPVRIGRKG